MGFLGNLFRRILGRTNRHTPAETPQPRTPTKREFGELIQATLRKIGDPRESTFDEAEFRITTTSNDESSPPGILNLHNLYATYCGLVPEAREGWLVNSCIGLAKPIDIPDDFEDAKPDLYPALRSKGFAEVLKRDARLRTGKTPDVPSEEVSEYLIACLVYDTPRTMSFVNDDKLKEWGVSWYEAMEAARLNLEEKQGRLAVANEKVYICDTDDAYDATRMLKIEKIRGLPVQGDHIAIPVTRDCLIVAGTDDLEGLGMAADLALSMLEAPRPICGVAHRLVGDRWEVWNLPAEHPHYAKFHELELRFLGGEYNDQKEYLEKLHEQEGPDVFVASFSVMSQENGPHQSFATWSKGVPTWLPKTDRIAFFNPDDKSSLLVEWQQAIRECGDAMTSLELYPQRWFVDTFPSAEQLQRMGGERIG